MENVDNLEAETGLDSGVDDSLGASPNWIIKWGILTLFVFLLVILILCAIIKYPETIETTLVITTLTPPVQIVANANGRLQHLFVKDGQPVKRGEILAVIESPCSYKAIIKLREEVRSLGGKIDEHNINNITILRYDSLGDLQNEYNSFSRSISSYQAFRGANSFKNKIKNIERQIAILDQSRLSLNRQISLLNEDFELTRLQYQRDSLLHEKKVVSDMTWETSKKSYIKDLYAIEIANGNILSLDEHRGQMVQTLEELKDNFTERTIELEQMIVTSLNALSTQILRWENSYLIKAPFDGNVVLNEFWTPLQNIKLGENVLIMVPEKADSLTGRIKLPVLNSGKVKTGQRVNIKLDEYSYIEYGLVTGVISRISSIPDNNFYTAEVALTNKLITTYNKEIEYNERITGKAEIVVDDLSLLERFFLQFLAIFKK